MTTSAPIHQDAVASAHPRAWVATSRSVAARRWAIANLAAQVGIVVTGGLVRLTGSGLGCPTWPECVPGSYVPVVHQAQGYHKDIEFGNRMLTVLLVVIAAVVVTRAVRGWRRGEVSRGYLVLASIPLLGVLAQAVLGGITVLTRLDPATVAAHFLLSMALISASTVLLLRSRPALAHPEHPVVANERDPAEDERGAAHDGPGPEDGAPSSPLSTPLVRLAAAATAATAAAVLVLGTVVTGSGPHSGDATEPARFDLAPRTISMIHSGVVWIFAALVVALALRLRPRRPRVGPAASLGTVRDSGTADVRMPRDVGAARAEGSAGASAPPADGGAVPARTARRRIRELLGITAAQGVVGYVQYATGLPSGLVAVHLLLAALFTVAVTAVVTSVLRPI